VGNHAIGTVIRGARRDDNHLLLGLAQVAFPFEDRVVVGEEGPELIRPVSQCQEDVRDEPRLLLHRFDRRAEIGR
jgi:hypothetical protein